MATKKRASLEAQLLSWGSAAGLAVLVAVLLLVLGGWTIIQAIWMAGVTFLVVGSFNYFLFASPNPPLAGRMEPAGAAPAARSAQPAAKPAPKPAAKPAARAEAPAPKPAPAPAQEPAAARADAAPAAKAETDSGTGTDTGPKADDAPKKE